MAKFANFLKHYGMPRRSGRYPYGSGDNPYQHSGDILTRIDELRSQGKSEKEIAEALNLSTTQLRAQKSIAKAERRSQEVATAKALKADGKNPTEIARIMGYKNESSIRSLLNEDAEARMNCNIPKSLRTGEKMMAKSVNIGDQLSQVIGIYYPHRIDNYVKYVRSQKFYGRYNDDWYIMSPSKDELEDLLENVKMIATELGIHINEKKTKIVKISSTYKFLQVKYSLTADGKVIQRINPKRVTSMRRKLKRMAALVDQGKLPYQRVEDMFKSWMGSFYKLLSKQQRQNLLSLFEDLFDKAIFVTRRKLMIFDRAVINDAKGVLQNEAMALEVRL